MYDRAGPLGPPAAVRGKRARGPGRPRQARVSSVSASHVVTAPATGWKPSGVRKQRALLPYGQRGPCGSISTHSRPAGPVLTKPDGLPDGLRPGATRPSPGAHAPYPARPPRAPRALRGRAGAMTRRLSRGAAPRGSQSLARCRTLCELSGERPALAEPIGAGIHRLRVERAQPIVHTRGGRAEPMAPRLPPSPPS